VEVPYAVSALLTTIHHILISLFPDPPATLHRATPPYHEFNKYLKRLKSQNRPSGLETVTWFWSKLYQAVELLNPIDPNPSQSGPHRLGDVGYTDPQTKKFIVHSNVGHLLGKSSCKSARVYNNATHPVNDSYNPGWLKNGDCRYVADFNFA
jgi:hypothetical protein